MIYGLVPLATLVRMMPLALVGRGGESETPAPGGDIHEAAGHMWPTQMTLSANRWRVAGCWGFVEQ